MAFLYLSITSIIPIIIICCASTASEDNDGFLPVVETNSHLNGDVPSTMQDSSTFLPEIVDEFDSNKKFQDFHNHYTAMMMSPSLRTSTTQEVEEKNETKEKGKMIGPNTGFSSNSSILTTMSETSTGDSRLSLSRLVVSKLASSILIQHQRQQQMPGPQQEYEYDEQLVHFRMNHHRKLDDLDEFQLLFQDAKILLPDFETSQKVALITFTLSAYNIVCQDIVFGDININYGKQSDTRLTFQINVLDLDISCELDFRWDYGLIGDDGHAMIRTADSSVSTSLEFTSQNFNFFPPNNVNIETCNTNINIDDLRFTGFVGARVLNVFENLLSNRIENEISTTLCDELSSLGTTLLQDALEKTVEFFDEYTNSDNNLLPSWRLDPLYPEKQFISSIINNNNNNNEIVSLEQVINFNHPNDGISKIFVNGINYIHDFFQSWFASSITNPAQPVSHGQDLGINIFLRDNILDDKRSFTITSKNVETYNLFNVTLFEGHDRLTETTIELDEIRIFGFDTFTKFQPIIDRGNYTYQLDLQWDYLEIEIQVNVKIKPSTLPDSLLEDPTPTTLRENINILFTFDDIEAQIGMLLPVNELKLQQLEIGKLFFSNNILPCLFSTFLRDVQISSLSTSVKDIEPPTLRGFISTGVDRIISNSVEAAFLMYENTIIKSLPRIFQTKLRDKLNDIINDYVSSSDNDCDPITIMDEYIDFRDLFLQPDFSRAIGGFGDSRYGDIVSNVFNFVRGQLRAKMHDSNENGNEDLLQINSMIVHRFTESQSGVQGMIRFPSEIFNITFDDFSSLQLFKSFIEQVEVSLSDFNIRNLDTIVAPMDILMPTTNQHPHSLLNRINFGSAKHNNPQQKQHRHLNATITLKLNLIGEEEKEPSSLYRAMMMFNEIDISVTASSIEFLMNILAMIKSSYFLRFPLNDIMNPFCWLSIIPAKTESVFDDIVRNNNNSYILHGPNGPPRLSFNRLMTAIFGMRVNADCRNCYTATTISSNGGIGTNTNTNPSDSNGFGSILDDLMDIFNNQQNQTLTTVLGDRLGLLIEDLAMSQTLENFVHRILVEVPKFCPHSPDFSSVIFESSNNGDETAGDRKLQEETVTFNIFKIFKNTIEELPPALSTTSIDSIVFTGASALPIGMVLLTEVERSLWSATTSSLQSHASSYDMLSKQIEFTSPQGITLLDLTKYKQYIVTFNEIINPNFILNQFLGEYYDKDDDGGFLTLPFPNDVIMQRDISVLGLTFKLDSIRIGGLNSFTKFDLLDIVAPQSLTSTIQLEHLIVDLDFSVDSIITQDPPQKFKVSLEAHDVSVILPMFVAIDLDALGSLELGSLLHSSNILPCILSTFYELDFSGLNITIGGFQKPKIQGLMEETSLAVLTFTTSIFNIFNNRIDDSISSILRAVVKDFMNDNVLNLLSDATCPQADIVDEFIDFRDLLLESEDAKFLGGNGDGRYGDVLKTIYNNYILESILVPEDGLHSDLNSLLQINSMVIRPLTKWQSGVEGVLLYAGDLLSFANHDLWFVPYFEMLEIDLSNPKIRNLDTFVAPSDILQPTMESYSLVNRINLGGDALLGPPPNTSIGPPLNASVNVLMTLTRENSKSKIPISFDISVATKSFGFMTDILAMVTSSGFLRLPLKDIMNFHCWLATIPAPIDLHGVSRTLSLQSVLIDLFSLQADGYCRNCIGEEGSAFSVALREIVDILDESQSIARLLDVRLGTLIREILMSESLQNVTNRFLIEAPKFCPHSPEYTGVTEGIVKATDLSVQNFPPLFLSMTSIDTVLFTAVAGVELAAAFLLHAERQGFWAIEKSNPYALLPTEDIRLLDWTNMNDSGISPVIIFVFEQVKNFLNSGFLRRNLQMKFKDKSSYAFDHATSTGGFLDGLLELDYDGFFNLPIKKVQYEIAGLTFSIDAARMAGLDSFTHMNLLDPIDPQILQNIFHLDELSIELDTSVGFVATADEPPQQIRLSFKANAINVTLPVSIALDTDLFNALELGSLLRMKDILLCVLSTIHHLYILPEMQITFGNFHKPTIKGLMSETDQALSNLTETIFRSFNEDNIHDTSTPGDNRIEDVLASFLRDFIRPLINGQFLYYIRKSGCKNIMLNSSSGGGAHNNGSQDNSYSYNGRRLTEGKYIDFRDLLLSEADASDYGGSGTSQYGDVFRFAYATLHEHLLQVDPNTGMSAANNKIIGPLTRSMSGQSGVINFKNDILNTGIKLNVGELRVAIRLRFFDVAILNMDSIGVPLSLLDPFVGEPHQLNNTVNSGAIEEEPLRFKGRFLIEVIQDDGAQIRNDVEFSSDFYTLAMVLTILVKISEEKFAAFPIRDLSNTNCWLAMVPAQMLDLYGVRLKELDPTAAITHLAASIARMNLTLHCISCTGPRINDFVELLSTPAAIDDLTATANGILRYIAETASDKLGQVQIDRMLNEAPRRCPHSPQYEAADAKPILYKAFKGDGYANSFMRTVLVFVVVTVCLLTLVAIVVFCIWLLVRRRHKRLLVSYPKERLAVLLGQQRKEDEREAELNNTSHSMFQSSAAIPTCVRYGIPVVILANIGFFLSGHLSLGATVNIEGQIAGEHFLVEKFFEFSMARSTLDIWKAGGKELAILILIFSGIWPYTKQLVTLILWFLPPSVLSVSSRGSTLLWLDALGKWSMVDIFTLLVCIAAFRVSVVSPEKEFLPDNFYSFHLMVVPLWGLYANMIAQLISQISSHFIIHYHRRIVSQGTKEYNKKRIYVDAADARSRDNRNVTTPSANIPSYATDSVATAPATTIGRTGEQLRRHGFARAHRGYEVSNRLVVRRYVNPLFVFVSVSLMILLILGCIYPSFSIEVLGIIGLAVESGQGFKEAVKKHSVFSMAKSIIDQAKFSDSSGNYFGLGALALLCVFCVLVVPVVQMMALLFQWFDSITEKTRSKLCFMIEILQAWQYAEVYIISVIVASWQLGPVSDFMVNAYCDSLSDTLSTLEYYGILHARDAQCFQVQATIENATYLIVAGAILLALMNTFVTKATLQYFRDKDVSNKYDECYTIGNSAEELLEVARLEREVRNPKRIRPPPVLFTDTFRWFLIREEGTAFPVFPIGPASAAASRDRFVDEMETGRSNTNCEGEEEMTDALLESFDNSNYGEEFCNDAQGGKGVAIEDESNEVSSGSIEHSQGDDSDDDSLSLTGEDKELNESDGSSDELIHREKEEETNEYERVVSLIISSISSNTTEVADNISGDRMDDGGDSDDSDIKVYTVDEDSDSGSEDGRIHTDKEEKTRDYDKDFVISKNPPRGNDNIGESIDNGNDNNQTLLEVDSVEEGSDSGSGYGIIHKEKEETSDDEHVHSFVISKNPAQANDNVSEESKSIDDINNNGQVPFQVETVEEDSDYVCSDALIHPENEKENSDYEKAQNFAMWKNPTETNDNISEERKSIENINVDDQIFWQVNSVEDAPDSDCSDGLAEKEEQTGDFEKVHSFAISKNSTRINDNVSEERKPIVNENDYDQLLWQVDVAEEHSDSGSSDGLVHTVKEETSDFEQVRNFATSKNPTQANDNVSEERKYIGDSNDNVQIMLQVDTVGEDSNSGSSDVLTQTEKEKERSDHELAVCFAMTNQMQENGNVGEEKESIDHVNENEHNISSEDDSDNISIISFI